MGILFPDEQHNNPLLSQPPRVRRSSLCCAILSMMRHLMESQWKSLQDRCYMADGGGSDNDAGGRVLNQLKFMDEVVGQTKKERTAVIEVRYEPQQQRHRGVDTGGRGKLSELGVIHTAEPSAGAGGLRCQAGETQPRRRVQSTLFIQFHWMDPEKRSSQTRDTSQGITDTLLQPIKPHKLRMIKQHNVLPNKVAKQQQPLDNNRHRR